jgi:hypothetical protein
MIFPAYEISHFIQWDPVEHLRRYMSDQNLETSLHMRQEFLSTYTASTRSVEKLNWMRYPRTLPESGEKPI